MEKRKEYHDDLRAVPDNDDAMDIDGTDDAGTSFIDIANAECSS